MTRRNNLTILLFIIVLGGLLRFIFLDRYPISLNWDEISHGYNSYTISKFGVDEWGQKLPLIFRAYGDYKLPLYIYLTSFLTKIFGISAITTRFISAFSGTLAIAGIYMVGNYLFSKKVGLIAAFLLAITPWHFFISRPALEANLGLTLAIFGFYFLLRLEKEDDSRSGFFSAILFGLSAHSYNSERFFVPLFIFVFLIFFKRKNLKKYLMFVVVLTIFYLPVFVQTVSGTSLARFDKLKILDEATIYQIGNDYQNSKLPYPISKMVHNRPVFLTVTIAKKYLNYFQPQFFDQSVGSHSQFAIPGQNLLGLPLTLAVILCLVITLTSRRSNKLSTPLLLWFLLSPVAGSLTKEPAHVLRGSLMIMPIVLFGAVAMSWFSTRMLTLFLGLQVIFFCQYLGVYFGRYAVEYAPSWQYGYQEVYQLTAALKKPGQKVIFTKAYGEPHAFLNYFQKISPLELNDPDRSIRFYQSGWYWTDKVDDYYFVNDWDIPKTITTNIRLESGAEISTHDSLIVTTGQNTPQGLETLNTIKYPNGENAFIISKAP